MWTFSRSTVDGFAPFSTLAALVLAGLATWRWIVGDTSGGLALTIFAIIGGLYAVAGWRLRPCTGRSVGAALTARVAPRFD